MPIHPPTDTNADDPAAGIAPVADVVAAAMPDGDPWAALIPDGALLPPPGTTVLQVIPSLVSGGAERGCVDIALALVAAGCRSIVASAGGPMVRELEWGGVEHVTLPLKAKNPLRLRANAARLARVIRERRVDIVHARSRAPAWSALWAARRTGARFMTTFHGTYGARTALKRRYNSVMVAGDRVIAISRFIAQHIQQVYGTDPAKIRIVPRGIDLRRFEPSHVRAEAMTRLAEAWRVPEEMQLVLLPGRLTRWKGALVFLHALARLKRPDVMGVLVGRADFPRFRAELDQTIRRLKLLGRVRIIEGCEDMPAAYALSAVVVSASTEPEAFGRVIVESQAMGRRTIVTDHGAVDETVIPGATAWTVPPSDPDALAAAIEHALAQPPEMVSALAAAAEAHVRAQFSKELMCARTLAVYAELVALPR